MRTLYCLAFAFTFVFLNLRFVENCEAEDGRIISQEKPMVNLQIALRSNYVVISNNDVRNQILQNSLFAVYLPNYEEATPVGDWKVHRTFYDQTEIHTALLDKDEYKLLYLFARSDAIGAILRGPRIGGTPDERDAALAKTNDFITNLPANQQPKAFMYAGGICADMFDLKQLDPKNDKSAKTIRNWINRYRQFAITDAKKRFSEGLPKEVDVGEVFTWQGYTTISDIERWIRPTDVFKIKVDSGTINAAWVKGNLILVKPDPNTDKPGWKDPTGLGVKALLRPKWQLKDDLRNYDLNLRDLRFERRLPREIR